MLRGEVREVVGEEDVADDVFEKLDVGVGLEAVLADEGLDSRDRPFVVADVTEDLGRRISVKDGQVGAPLPVAGAAFRVVAAGDGPAPDVLAAGGELDDLGSIGSPPRANR